MSTLKTQPSPARHHGNALGTRELIALTASLWALNAFAIDMMLPALGQISTDLDAQNANDRQLMIVVYLFLTGSLNSSQVR